MIPKIIHYCWFGNAKMPALEKKCLKSWKKYCHGFEIKRWDESNFDIESCEFTREAYKAKKWAFVADYVRLTVLKEYGGFYLDTDIELLKPIDDLIRFKAFSGFEDDKLVAAGFMGSEKENELFCQFLNYYQSVPFKNNDGSINMTSIPAVLTKICSSNGFTINNSFQEVNGFALFPSDFFYPKNYETGLTNITKNSYSIHHYSASWFKPKQRKQLRRSWRLNRIKKALISILGEDTFKKIRNKRKNN